MALIFALTNFLIAQNNYKKIGSEYRINGAIHPQILDRAIPSGGKPVDRTPPYLALRDGLYKNKNERFKSKIKKTDL